MTTKVTKQKYGWAIVKGNTIVRVFWGRMVARVEVKNYVGARIERVLVIPVTQC